MNHRRYFAIASTCLTALMFPTLAPAKAHATGDDDGAGHRPPPLESLGDSKEGALPPADIQGLRNRLVPHLALSGKADALGDEAETSELPSSSAALETQKLELTESVERALMQRICPTEVETIVGQRELPYISCPGSCPDKFEHEGGTLRLKGAYLGDFSGDGTRDFILDMGTRECHSDGSTGHHGAIYLDQHRAPEEMRYQHGVAARSCEPVSLKEGDQLLCTGAHMGTGGVVKWMDLLAVEDGHITANTLIDQGVLYDHRGHCHFPDGQFDAKVTTTVIDDLTGDGQAEIALGITERLGQPAGGVEPDEVDDPCDEDSYDIEESRRLKIWTYDGDKLHRHAQLESEVEHAELNRYR